ncbi:uncharacterized protein NECHADRAFT_86298 [Fusarium vanettenii 77-13-4]|uniref:Laccase n=1 Tax=Fusarium vanettenii (strain ATCC MYA-4622 / CBS 123669 / FGSC 9596 / NRRL 45880 / 77-13-4) TaxID=660122 RepID=C7ZEP5_FUSV7|nr:uncharacterized protein NECHADRAFT_86298 [Fusarium vanettenii 77-13-4]EEU37368.1 hypothetical protein NECHADRAFT_86298 [Fusarium vanettenii 77-13-4]
MGLYEACRAFILCVATFFSIPLGQHDDSQQPIFSFDHNLPDYPKFPAPHGPDTVKNFTCRYPELENDWVSCASETNRKCWLRNKHTQKEFNITTNYEIDAPPGVLREYWLVVDNMTINGDGVLNPEGKVFNQTYPGPWIQACWGDTIRVHVTNKLKYNGTTIHWHGLRQFETMEMDGVNGVTQCPIAPNDTFTYEFKALQYGTSWYHSHYSLQYADGLAGPITIFGPSSADYDEAKDPILITDWNHRSAFQDWERELTRIPTFPRMNSILINGVVVGNFAGSFPRERFNMTVTQGKKYLLRVINTSVDTTFVFSIDNHLFEVMSSDFVPIKPYKVSNVLIGIGQRYHIVLHANPINNITYPKSEDGNYWIRTVPADGCKGFEVGNEPDERQGILRYNASSTSVPTTWRDPYSLACRDEDYDKLVPIHKWNITQVNLTNWSQNFDIGLEKVENRPALGNNFSWWSFGDNPLWVDFSKPTITGLNRTDPWPKDYVVVPAENKDGWVYLVITAPNTTVAGKKKIFAPVAHPLHLHGHDFALLAQGNDSTRLGKGEVTLKFDNPPRRDVALIPSGGYLVVAFKADNPGSWLFHCHIAWHASSGLALQIMEREEDLKKLMTEKRLRETRRICENWDLWYSNPKNHWNASGPFQDDSGV